MSTKRFVEPDDDEVGAFIQATIHSQSEPRQRAALGRAAPILQALDDDALGRADVGIVASCLIEFPPEISAGFKRDIILSNAFVQSHMRNADVDYTDDWFVYFKKKLWLLGWYELYLEPPSASIIPADEIHPHTRAAIERIGVAGAAHGQEASVKKLVVDVSAQRTLEGYAVAGDHAFAQFMPCVTNNNGMVETLLYHRYYDNKLDVAAGFFSSEVNIKTGGAERMAVMAFRPEKFEKHRQMVMGYLAERTLANIHLYEI
jgi:hypothetical protein